MRVLRGRGRVFPLVTERRADIAVVLGLLLWALPNVPWWWRPPGHTGTPPAVCGYLVLGMVQSLPFVMRRSHPVVVAAVVTAALAVHMAVPGDKTAALAAAVAAAYGIGAYTRTAHPWARRLGVLTLLAAAIVAFEAHRAVFGVPLLVIGTAFLVGEGSAQHRRDTAGAVAEAHRAERNQIARELHDVLAHQLTAIVVQAGSARVALAAAATATAAEADGGGSVVAAGGGPMTASGESVASGGGGSAARVEPVEVLGVVERLAREALGELGHLLGVLRSAPDDVLARRPAPGLRDLEQLADIGRAAGLAVAVEVRGPARVLPDGADLVAYRIVQESVTNAARHAPGARTLISVRYDPDDLAITVANGPGSRPGTGPGLGRGLLGMRERAELHGGSLRAAPTADGGFEVRARIPVPA
ncbi:sensor histidine kinase [Catenulispora subtropica]